MFFFWGFVMVKLSKTLKKLLDDIGDSDDYNLQYLFVRNNFKNIKIIPNPNYELLKTVVWMNGDTIHCIDKKFVTDELRLLAIKSNGLVIKDLENVNNYEEQKAVESNGMAIAYIKSPDIDLCKLALEKTDGVAIVGIKKPSVELQSMAVDLMVERSLIGSCGSVKTVKAIVSKIADFHLLLRLKKGLNSTLFDSLIVKSKYWKNDANLILEMIDSE